MSVVRAALLRASLTSFILFLSLVFNLARLAHFYTITTAADAFNSRFNRDAGEFSRLELFGLHGGLIVADISKVDVLLQLPRHRRVRPRLLDRQLQAIVTCRIASHNLLHLVHMLYPLSLIVALILAAAPSSHISYPLLGCAHALL